MTFSRLRLADGRDLAYAEYGAPMGRPLFYFHGGNGTRLEGLWFDEQAKRHNVRIIAPDRPGFGRSDFADDRTLLTWADDVAALADHLDIAQLRLIGLSGGGPHALAVAAALPERVAKCAVVSSIAPPNANLPANGMFPMVRALFWTAKYWPSANRFLLKQMQKFYADPQKMRAQMLNRLPAPDQDLLKSRPDVLEIFARDTVEAHRQGIAADAQEWQLYIRPWGFALEDIALPVSLWYGQYDVMVPPAMGRFLDQHLPQSQLHLVEDGAHFSTINNHFIDICADLFD